MALTDKRTIFIQEYLIDFNATRAAKVAGYSKPRQQGSRLLTNVDIRSEIDGCIEDKAMKAEEVLIRLGDIARCSVEDLMDVDEEGKLTFNFKRAQEENKLGMIKSISPTAYGTKVELQDQMRALELIGKQLGLFKDKVEVSGKDGGAIQNEVTINDGSIIRKLFPELADDRTPDQI